MIARIRLFMARRRAKRALRRVLTEAEYRPDGSRASYRLARQIELAVNTMDMPWDTMIGVAVELERTFEAEDRDIEARRFREQRKARLNARAARLQDAYEEGLIDAARLDSEMELVAADLAPLRRCEPCGRILREDEGWAQHRRSRIHGRAIQRPVTTSVTVNPSD